MAPYDIRSMALESLPFLIVGNDERDGFIMTFQNDEAARRAPSPNRHASPQHRREPEKHQPDTGAPTHPVREMQAAFSESLIEATNNPDSNKPSLRALDPKARRQHLIEQHKDEPLSYTRWRYRPGQRHHELWKLMAQISFGVYLLLTGRSNSTDQVITILQGHIDDIDEFLEVSLEDLNEAARDLTSRIQHLRLPMENRQVFEKMLEDRQLRAEFMSGSEMIEHVLSRTMLFLDQADDDINNGFAATKAFSSYLHSENNSRWRTERPNVLIIYEAMVNNTDGWNKTFNTLGEKSRELNDLVITLTQMVADMQRIAGEVSRRTWVSIEPFSAPLHSQAAAHRSHISQATHVSPPSSFHKDSQSIRSHASTQRSHHSSTQQMASNSSVHSNTHSNHPGDGSLTPPPDRLTMQIGFEEMLAMDMDEVMEGEDSVQTVTAPAEDDFILQPSVYTPKPTNSTPLSPPESQASPPPEQEEVFLLSDKRYSKNHPVETTPPITLPRHRTSLRQRVSLKGRTPENIRIPPPQRVSHQPTNLMQVPVVAQRQVSAPVNLYQQQQQQQQQHHQQQQLAPDSAYGPDMARHFRNRSNSSSDISQHMARPQLLIPSPAQSPGEQQQFYHPVLASPHSPLQQRPHTSHNTPRIVPNTPSGSHSSFYPAQRNIPPSRSGGASMLSASTALTYETAADGSRQQVKKKKSKFGWLKKAFQLDEEERAAFEARRQADQRNLYYDDRSSQFLDGRRIR